jgi:hypothetical protein
MVGAGVAAVGTGAVAWGAYHNNVYSRRNRYCTCAKHINDEQPSCKPADTRIHRRRAEYGMRQRCIDEQCCGPEHTSCYVNCPTALPDDASMDGPDDAAPVTEATDGPAAVGTTAGPTAGPDAVANATRALEDSANDNDEETEAAWKTKALATYQEMDITVQGPGLRRMSEDDGAGGMCPSAPPGCLESFIDAGKEWETIPGCSEFIGANLYCDQDPEDADDSTDVEESGTGLGFLSAAFFVWIGCA